MEEIETLYRRHAPAVLRFATGLCGDRSRAEDIVSETFVRILTRSPHIETRTALAYLLAVARNVFLGRGRAKRQEVPLPDDLRSHVVDPAASLDERADLHAVLRALADLPEGERAALLLRVDHGLSYEDVAATLAISVNAAKVRVHRASLRLAAARGQKGNI
jgi:RNA polymerase sigma-70 factor (ECF subfamily)